jgi:hypothetical protein
MFCLGRSANLLAKNFSQAARWSSTTILNDSKFANHRSSYDFTSSRCAESANRLVESDWTLIGDQNPGRELEGASKHDWPGNEESWCWDQRQEVHLGSVRAIVKFTVHSQIYPVGS